MSVGELRVPAYTLTPLRAPGLGRFVLCTRIQGCWSGWTVNNKCRSAKSSWAPSTDAGVFRITSVEIRPCKRVGRARGISSWSIPYAFVYVHDGIFRRFCATERFFVGARITVNFRVGKRQSDTARREQKVSN